MPQRRTGVGREIGSGPRQRLTESWRLPPFWAVEPPTQSSVSLTRGGQLVSNCWERRGRPQASLPEARLCFPPWGPGEPREADFPDSAAASAGLTIPGGGQALGVRWRLGGHGESFWWPQHPYPSEEQKKQLAQDTGLTILQVNNW